jgi:putative FmdB family regulatory protein
MPTYDYLCTACGHAFEREQRMTEDPIKKCPKCGKAKAQRQITGGNFILKGGGWYADLYHKPGGKKASASEGSSTKTETSSSSSSSSSDSSSSSSGPSTPAKTESKPSKKD